MSGGHSTREARGAGLRGRRAAGIGVLAIVIGAACARQVAPPGGPEDVRPPVVINTVPAAESMVTDLSTPIRFDFDERISERASGSTLDEAISISPRAGVARVRHSRRSLTLTVEGGLQPGLVYRVTLNAVVSDMFGNRMADPFELIFSTGATPVATTVAGEVWSRTSGQPLAAATLQASRGDGLVHQSVADRQGIFAFRYLPEGEFTLTAFDDVNRNGEVDSTEVQGRSTTTIAAGDTVLVDVAVLAPDTLPAVVTRASAIDSLTVAVEFDDFLDPAADHARVGVSLVEPQGADPTAAVRIFDEVGYRRYVDSVSTEYARLDSLERAATAAAAAAAGGPDSAAIAVPAPSARPDTVANPPDTVLVGATGSASPTPGRRPAAAGRVPPSALQPLQGSNPGQTRDGRRVLPGRRLVVIVDRPVTLDAEYEVTVTGVVNISGLTGGGGSAVLIRASPPPDTTGVDSMAVDTLTVDTLRVDTLSVDTFAVDALARSAASARPSPGSRRRE